VPEQTQTSDDTARDCPARGAALTAGTLLGRYVVRELLGEGAMGSVYLAYDFALDRRVALKLLHPRETDSSQRLLREAKAMARLSHPNVVAVHDLGTVHERAFLAMEYVEGPTLRAWLAEKPRAWVELREVFLGAGRGLAAAHAAGLVHRDFKPENVLIDAHGSARVTDFGVARPVNEPSGTAGTVGYIAPEQRRGEVTPAADQYSFCVTLSEQLAHTAGVPTRVRAAVQRGRSEVAAQRFASMNALLAELSPGTVSQRGPTLLAAAALLGVVGLGALFLRQDPALCARGPAELTSVWDADVRAGLARAFSQSPRPWVQATFPETALRLDRWAQAWTAEHRDACEATRVHGTQSQQLLDLRMACLGARKAEARALTELLTTGEAPGRLDRAAEAVANLPSISGCSGARLLHAPAEPPLAAPLQAKVDAVRLGIAQAHARHDTGDVRQAETELRALVAEAKAIPAPAPQAEAQVQLARALVDLKASTEAEEIAFEAFTTAQSLGKDATAMEAALYAGYASAIGHQSGARWRAIAASLAKRTGGQPSQLASLEKMRAFTLAREGLLEEALAAARAALAFRESELGPNAPELADELYAVSQNLGLLGRIDEGLPVADAVLAIRRRIHGDDHPTTAVVQQLRADFLGALGRDEEALALQQGVRAVMERAYGKSHLGASLSRTKLVEKLSQVGRHAEALALAREALALVESTPGSDPVQLAMKRAYLGEALLRAGQAAEGLTLLELARDLLESKSGSYAQLSATRQLLAEALLALGRPREALVEAEKCLAVRVGARGNPVHVGHAHLLAAKAFDAIEDRHLAEPHLASARAALQGDGPNGRRERAELDAYLKVRTP
jgi:hypothetical protein